MRLEYELEIRDLACGLIPDGLGMDIGEGWRDIAVDAIGRLAEVSRGRVEVEKIGEKWGLLDIRPGVRGLDIDTIRAVFDVASHARSRSADVCEPCGRFGEIRRAGAGFGLGRDAVVQFAGQQIFVMHRDVGMRLLIGQHQRPGQILV